MPKQPAKQPATKKPIRNDAIDEIDRAIAAPNSTYAQRRDLRVTKGQLKGGRAAVSAERLERLMSANPITGE